MAVCAANKSSIGSPLIGNGCAAVRFAWALIAHVVSSQMHHKPSSTADKSADFPCRHTSNTAAMSFRRRAKYGVSHCARLPVRTNAA